MTSKTLDAEQLLARMCDSTQQLIETRGLENPYIIGIHSGGVWLAERLHQHLGVQDEMGVLDISFYRDDFTRVGLNPKVGVSKLPSATEDRNIILVDDVLMTGRTARAALNELFEFGRPASVTLVTLIDLQRRELPIQADVIGGTLTLSGDQQVKLTGPSPLELTISQRSK